MSDQRPRVGLDVNELAVDESNEPTTIRRQTSREGSGTTQTEETLSRGSRLAQISTSQETTSERIHRVRGPNVTKRTLPTEKQTNRNHAEQKHNKKPKSDTAVEPTHIQARYLEPFNILSSKPKVTKSVAEKELILKKEGSCFRQTRNVALAYEDLTEASDVMVESETHQSPPSASERTSPRPLEELVEMLLKFQKLFHEDDDGDTLLHLAIIHNEYVLAYAAITAMVERKTERQFSGLDIQNHLRQAPIHLAVITCQPRVVKYLTEHGADVNSIDRNGQTALHLACKNADLEDVRALRQGVENWQRKHENCEETIDVNVRNFEGLAPIHLATLTGSCEVLHELLAMEACIDLQDSTSGRTALHHAVEAHNPVAARFLLTHDANVDAQTFAGNTPLHTASGRHMDAIISLLLEFGADLRLENVEGDPPLSETHTLYSRAKRSTESSNR